MVTENLSRNRSPELYFSFVLGFIFNFYLIFWTDPLDESNYVCSRFFQSCGDFISFKGHPHSWDTSLFYQTVYFALVASVYFFLKGKDCLARGFLIYPLVVEALLGFIIYENSVTPPIYYQFFPCLVFLFSKDYKSDLKWLVPMLYFFASLVKLDTGWFLGEEINPAIGLPLIPGILLLPFLWFFFFMEFTAFALLSKSRKIQNFYLYFFYSAHLYAFAATGYHFQLLALPLIYFVFQDKGPLKRPSPLLIACAVYLTAVNLLPHITDSDYKKTGQGDSLAFDMVDADRKTISRTTTFFKDGTSKTEKNFKSGFMKENPYKFWFQLKKKCTPDVERISWQFELSFNYGPYKKIVDVDDLCALKFDPFFKNSWIKAEGI